MRNGLSPDLIARVLGAAPKYTLAELEEKFPWCICDTFCTQPHGLYAPGWAVPGVD